MTEKLINKILDASPINATLNQRKSVANLRSPALITSDRSRTAKSCLKMFATDITDQSLSQISNQQPSTNNNLNQSQRHVRLYQEGEASKKRKQETIKNV